MIAALLAALVSVTNAQYRECVRAGACKAAAFEDPRSAANPKTGKSENIAAWAPWTGDDQPAIGVDWYDATAWCKWKGLRLASLRDLGSEKPATAIWLADKVGKNRAVRGGQSRSSEEPWGRAHWLTFRCVR